MTTKGMPLSRGGLWDGMCRLLIYPRTHMTAVLTVVCETLSYRNLFFLLEGSLNS